jgi:hypothetical protein
MLAEIEAVLLPVLLGPLELGFTLFHQFLSHHFSLLHSHGEATHFFVHAISDSLWELFESSSLVDVLGPSVQLLW